VLLQVHVREEKKRNLFCEIDVFCQEKSDIHVRYILMTYETAET